jgi:hypothetical protein
MVGCDFGPPGGVRYSLTISSTEGGSVTEPGEGVFPLYSEGRVVDLVATPDSGYRFDGWTGDVGTIADNSRCDNKHPERCASKNCRE